MENITDSDLTEYLTEFRLQLPVVEPISHYEEGELEAEWLSAAGFQQLTEPFKEGRELKSTEFEPILATLSKFHAEAIKHRVDALNRTVRGRTKSRIKRKPDIRDVFRDFDTTSTGTRSRSATPDSLDSIAGDEHWNNNTNNNNNNNTPPNDNSISLNVKPKQKLRRTPSAPLRGSAELFRGAHVRCDIPFYSADGIELLNFQRLGTIPRVRSGSDPSCSIGRQLGKTITNSRSDENLFTDSKGEYFETNNLDIDRKHITENVKANNNNTTNSAPDESISFENMCRATNQQTDIEWDQLQEPCCDIDDLSEIDLKRLQPLLWLELAALFDKHQINLDKRKPFKRKRKEEGNLFGISLNALIRRDQQITGEDSTLVPLFLQKVLNELNERGSKEEGILRVPGHKQKIEILYNELELIIYQKPEKVDNLLSRASVHDLSALLKRWLRELPQPLLANDLVHLFYQAHAISAADQYKALSMICFLLPHENRNTLRAILSFLNCIINRQTWNKMTKHNVATILAPSFFPPRYVHPIDKNDIEAQVKMAAQCCHMTKVLITQGEMLFMVPKRLIYESKTFKNGQNKKHGGPSKVKRSGITAEGCVINPNHIHKIVI